MILANVTALPSSVESAAIDALKQSPGILAALIVIVVFMRYITARDKNDQEERKAVRESQDKLSESVKTLAIVVEGVKDKLNR
jgi:hypothetical protein